MNENLKKLFKDVAGFDPESVEELCGSASNRRYARLSGHGVSYITVEGKDFKENAAFIALNRHFREVGLPVPEVFAVSEDGMSYIQEDLGDRHLSDLVAYAHKNNTFDELKPLLTECILKLAEIQFEGGRQLNYEVCYPSPEFDRRTILYDLNYFKYCFLKPSIPEFDENRLQDEFESLATDLLSCKSYGQTFLYRDFQSRNVMIYDGKPYFIDFQGGRRGPVYYDLASFIWQVRAAYPEDVKSYLLDTYIDKAEKYVGAIDRECFMKELRLFRLFRMLQVIGAYGFRGVVEHKAKFMESLIPALRDMQMLLDEKFESYPYLSELLASLSSLPKYSGDWGHDGVLEVKVYSFSYKKGIPEDYTGNGGGYVFDCRSIHNPGRYEQYKKLTGLDRPVIEFLENDGEIIDFLNHAEAVVFPHVRTYLERGFTHLSVSFGCTGGQHRSVYCAQHLAEHLASKYPQARIRLIHREQHIDKFI